MRAFVAIDLEVPPPLRPAMVRVPDHFHATLRFFDELPEAQVPRTLDALAAAARTEAPGPAELRGIGAFPNARDPRIVWVGFGEGRERVERLAAALERELRAAGAPPEERPFRAHATLLRVRGPRERREADALLALGPSISFGSQDVGALTLYESRLGAGAAEHRRLGSSDLGPG